VLALALASLLAATPHGAAAAASPPTTDPGVLFFVAPLSDADVAAMTGVVWRAGCPVPLSSLRNVHVAYRGVDGVVRSGVLTLHEAVAEDAVVVFKALLQAGFAIEQIAPATARGGDDAELMAANITSAFNCRPVTGGKGWSPHAYGRAIDINPLWNPYQKGAVVIPAAGRAFVVDRDDSDHVGLLTPRSPAVTLFERHGWTWGGRWRSLKDWQHVEKKPTAASSSPAHRRAPAAAAAAADDKPADQKSSTSP